MGERVEVIGSKPESKELPNGFIRLYHVTKARHLLGIRENGLVPSAIYDREFYGISGEVIDVFAPKVFKKQGVLRRNCIFAWFTKGEAKHGTTKKDVVLAIDTDQSRVFVSDMGYSGLAIADVWNEFLSEIELKTKELLGQPAGIDEKSKMLEKLLWTEFFDINLVNKIALAFNKKADDSIYSELSKLIQEGRGNIRKNGRKIARRFWRRVVPFSIFNEIYNYDPKKTAWIPSQTSFARIHIPEALVVGSVAPNAIHFISRGGLE